MFILMHKDVEVANIQIQHDKNNNPYLHVQQIINKQLMPWGTKKSSMEQLDKNFSEWNDSRCIPFGRPNYDIFLSRVGVSSNAELIAISHMCSLTDCYWFKDENASTTWKDVNFRDNGINSNIYQMLFLRQEATGFDNLNSPDLTTDGNLPKMWIQKNDDFYLIKSNEKMAIDDACAELIASEIFNYLQIPCVDYTIENHSNNICSVCKCFISSNDEEFVPIYNLFIDSGMNSIQDFVDFLRNNGFDEDLSKMFCGDFIIGNIDRHAKNYGIIIDADTGNIKRFAPLFDHGNSDLFNDISFMNYHPTGSSFDKIDLSPLSNIDKSHFLIHIKNVLSLTPYSELEQKEIIDRVANRVDSVLEKAIERDELNDREY